MTSVYVPNRAMTAPLSIDFLTTQNIVALPWPDRSPDLALIEIFWGVASDAVNVRTRPQMLAVLPREWMRHQNLNWLNASRVHCLYAGGRRPCLFLKHFVTFRMTPSLFFDN